MLCGHLPKFQRKKVNCFIFKGEMVCLLAVVVCLLFCFVFLFTCCCCLLDFCLFFFAGEGLIWTINNISNSRWEGKCSRVNLAVIFFVPNSTNNANNLKRNVSQTREQRNECYVFFCHVINSRAFVRWRSVSDGSPNTVTRRPEKMPSVPQKPRHL